VGRWLRGWPEPPVLAIGGFVTGRVAHTGSISHMFALSPYSAVNEQVLDVIPHTGAYGREVGFPSYPSALRSRACGRTAYMDPAALQALADQSRLCLSMSSEGSGLCSEEVVEIQVEQSDTRNTGPYSALCGESGGPSGSARVRFAARRALRATPLR
jgi:hypothetical protein